MRTNASCKFLLLFFCAVCCSQFATARRGLLQDAPTDMIMCDVAIVGGGPGDASVPEQLQKTDTSFVIDSGIRLHAFLLQLLHTVRHELA